MAYENGHTRALARALETGAWGIALIWVGAAMLMSLVWAQILLGLGVISLCAQAIRKQFGIKVDRVALVLGGLLIVMGLLALRVLPINGEQFLPVLLIAVGAALLAPLYARRHHLAHRSHQRGLSH